jgi:protease IV
MKALTRNQMLRLILALYGLALIAALGSLVARSRFWENISLKTKPGSVAVVRISGPIQTRMTGSGFGSSQDAEAIARRLHQISKDDTIKAIILRINSPGGTVGGVQEIYNEVLKCKAKGKKVVASLGDVAASGGYYIAASADKIVTNPGTITGSIGVILQFGNLEGLFQKVGIRLQVVKSGEHKDIGSPARSLTPEERRLLQASIDDAYAQFVDAVSAGRSMPREKVLPLADGRIFTGRQAMEAGLADELGDQQDALQTAIKLANLSPNPRVISDSSKSLRNILQNLSSEVAGRGLFESLGIHPPGFSLEYALR